MSDDVIAAGLARILERMRAEPGTLKRAILAHEAAATLRQFEGAFCDVRDEAIRQDRDAKPNRTVDQFAALTGIGRSTVVNARRIRRPGGEPHAP